MIPSISVRALSAFVIPLTMIACGDSGDSYIVPL